MAAERSANRPWRVQSRRRLDRFEHARVVIVGLVDPVGDGDRLEQVVRRRPEQRLRLDRVAGQPLFEILRRDHHRHAVVDRRHAALARGGDDGAGIDLAAGGAVSPGLPQAGEGDRPAVARPQPEGLARAAGIGARQLAPFVEAGGRHQAAAIAHGGAERGFVQNPFGAGVDEKRELLRVLDPGRHQPPAHQREAAGAAHHAHHGDRLGRRDVVARREILAVEVAEQGFEFFRRGGQDETSAHGQSGLSWLAWRGDGAFRIADNFPPPLPPFGYGSRSMDGLRPNFPCNAPSSASACWSAGTARCCWCAAAGRRAPACGPARRQGGNGRAP